MDVACLGCIFGHENGAVFDCDKGFPPRPCKERVTKKFGKWICPTCKEVCYDPIDTVATQCHSGHSVILTPPTESELRENKFAHEHPTMEAHPR